jgi:threonine dehydrogenase-like Zn-dependent dehydrogenase
MRANTWMGKTRVEVQNVPDPKILNSHDAIVKISSTAICGSDLHLFNGFIPTMRKGDILGHEFMGEVVETGSSVRKLKVGVTALSSRFPLPVVTAAPASAV